MRFRIWPPHMPRNAIKTLLDTDPMLGASRDELEALQPQRLQRHVKND